MFARDRNQRLVALALGLSLLVVAPGGVWAQRGADPGGTPRRGSVAPDEEIGLGSAARGKSERVLKLDKQTRQKLGKLPGNQLLDVRGKRMTVDRYKALRQKEQKQGAARIKSMQGAPAQGLSALQMDFEKAEEARLSAANAKVEAEAAKLGKRGAAPAGSARGEAIQTEALAIQKRVRGGNATPADETRAQALFEEFKSMGSGTSH